MQWTEGSVIGRISSRDCARDSDYDQSPSRARLFGSVIGRLGARAASRAETGHTVANVNVLVRSMADGRVSETPRKLRPVSTDPAQV